MLGAGRQERGRLIGTDGRNSRILLVEDDKSSASLLKEYLEKSMMDVLVEGNGARAMKTIEQFDPDMLLLDLMLPGKDGMTICRELRETRKDLPIIIVTALDESYDVVLGLESGADEYVIKPIEPRVLLARIRAVLRRTRERPLIDSPAEVMVIGRLRIVKSSLDVYLDGNAVSLTTAEFDLLWLLAQHAGHAVGRDQILNAFFGTEYDGGTRAVDSRVARLRAKFAQLDPSLDLIKTVRPYGYLLSV
jgi:two-component system, OmpR family, response regulator RstA